MKALHRLWAYLVRSLFLISLLFLQLSCGGDSSSTTPAVTKITVTPATASISSGQQTTFFADPVDANGTTVSGIAIIWTSSATDVATISSSGAAVGKASGTTQITASSAGVTSNSATLTVTPTVARVVISPMSNAIAVGGTQQFSATALDDSGNAISGVSFSWFCSFSGIATIDTNGLATGVAPGTVTIVATANSVNSQPAALTVNKP